MNWRLKALAFRALDVPGGTRLHYLLQRHVTRSWPRPAQRIDGLAAAARRVCDDYARHAGGTPETVIEIGAGRDLSVPLMLRQLGVREVTASDVERLARLELVQHAANRLLVGQHRFRTWDDLCQFGIHYRAPHHVSADDPAAECSCSHEVLEHVPVDQLRELLKALRAVTHGLTIHSIDYSDHFARSDRSISRLNFLRYSEAAWRPFNSRRQYVNRLRHSDYVRLFRDAGFTIIEASSIAGEPVEDVAAHFRRYEPSDLFAIKGRIVAA